MYKKEIDERRKEELDECCDECGIHEWAADEQHRINGSKWVCRSCYENGYQPGVFEAAGGSL
jgi:formylmethanofuran dehydrogenase subunit E